MANDKNIHQGNAEGSSRTGIIIAAVVVLIGLILAYNYGWFGGSTVTQNNATTETVPQTTTTGTSTTTATEPSTTGTGTTTTTQPSTTGTGTTTTTTQ